MRRGFRGAWFIAGLVMLGAMVGGGREALAGSVTLKGAIHPLPGGSPFLYQFELILTGGTLAPGTTLTVGSLVGVTTGSGTHEPPYTGGPANEVWDVPPGGIVQSGNPGDMYNVNSIVTWDYVSGPTFTYTGTPIDVGLFTVETAYSYPDDAPPVTPGVTQIPWSSTVVDSMGGTSKSGGNITLSSVPEPSSLMLLLVGSGMLPMAILRHRRRSRSPRTDSR